MSRPVVDRYGLAPLGARLAPAHWLCRLRRHGSLCWADDNEPDAVSLDGRAVRAECGGCGRDQRRVRVLYPRDRTVSIPTATDRARGACEAGEPTDNLDGTGTELVLDVAAERIEEATKLLTDRLLPVDILSHPRLQAAVLDLGPTWSCAKTRLDHARTLAGGLEAAGGRRSQRRPSTEVDPSARKP